MKTFDDIAVLYPDLQSQVTVSGIFRDTDIDFGIGNGILYQVEALRDRHLIDVIESFRHSGGVLVFGFSSTLLMTE